MATVQIKHVPDETHHRLRARAAAAHQSLQEYLLEHLIEEAARPTIDEWLQHMATRNLRDVPLADITDALRADRDSH